MERIQEQALNQRNERLKGLMRTQSNNQSPVQDAVATKIMPVELYNSAKTDNADVFFKKLDEYSSGNKLHGTTILDKVTPCGDSLLHVAATAKDDITKLLVPNHPDLITKVNFQGDTPLHLAAKTGKVEPTKALIDQAKSSNIIADLLTLQNNKGNTALHEAVIHHHFQVVDCLIKEYNHSLLSTYQNREYKTPLYLAVETCDENTTPDHVKILECLLQSLPVDEVSLKMSPAHAAVDKADQSVVFNSLSKLSPAQAPMEKTNLSDVILQKIAELKPQLFRVKDEKGELPLHYAASKGNTSIVKTLVEKFSDGVIQPNQEGLYPIHVACKSGQIDVVKLLLEQWTNPMDFVNANGKNILHIAAENGQEKLVMYILQSAANNSEYKDLVNATDLDGNTPLHLATKNGHSMAVFALVRNPLVHVYALNGEKLTSYKIAEKKCKQAEAEYAMPKDMEVDIENPDNERKNKTSSKIDFYGAMMTASILFFHAGPKSYFIDYLRTKGNPLLPKEELKSRRDTLLVVAVLVAGVTFAGALTVPKDPITKGSTTISKHDSTLKEVFIYFDMLSLNASVMAAIILCWAQLHDVKIANFKVWVASVLIGGSIYLMCLAFLFGLVIQGSTDFTFFMVIIVAQGLLFICQTAVCIPLIIPPSANPIFETLLYPYVYYHIFCSYFLFKRVLEVLSRYSREHKPKQVNEKK